MKHCSLLTLLVLSSSIGAFAQFVSPSTATPVDVKDQAIADSTSLQALLHVPYPSMTLRADDVVSVKVYGVKDFDITPRVGNDGMVRLPLIGDVPAAGSSLAELEKSIQQKLEDSGMITSPQVIVTGVSLPSQIVTVSGDAAKPGIFPAAGQLTLMDYISLAGGFNRPVTVETSPASPVITLVRPSLPSPVTISLGSDPRKSPYARIPIFAGDEIRIGKTGVVYTVGAFKSQGVFPLKSSGPTTVTNLIAMAGGIGFEAAYGDAHIVRATENGPVVISLNVSKILKGKIADITLQPDDILFVPTNQMKAALKGGGAGIIAGFATAYIYRY